MCSDVQQIKATQHLHTCHVLTACLNMCKFRCDVFVMSDVFPLSQWPLCRLLEKERMQREHMYSWVRVSVEVHGKGRKMLCVQALRRTGRGLYQWRQGGHQLQQAESRSVSASEP